MIYVITAGLTANQQSGRSRQYKELMLDVNRVESLIRYYLSEDFSPLLIIVRRVVERIEAGTAYGGTDKVKDTTRYW